MAMVASDIATIPGAGFRWYVLFLEDAFNDPIKAELQSNFLELGKEVGPDVLVVRGFDPTTFYSSVYETSTLYGEEWKAKITRPALLVTDTVPKALLGDPADLRAAKLILVPLGPFRSMPPGSLVDFLRHLVEALRDEDALRALQRLETSALRRRWGWLNRYVDLKPNFLGFGLNLNAVLDRALSPLPGG